MRLNILKIFLIILLLSIPVKPQSVEISAVGYSIVSGLTMYNQMKDRNAYAKGDPIYKSYSKRWHALQTLETISLVSVGIQIGTLNKLDWQKNTIDVLLLGSIRWIVRDGTYQLMQGNSFFRRSTQTTAQFERYGTPLVKISLLLALLTVKYLILPVLE